MIPFLILAAVITGLVLMHTTRPLWRGRAASADDQVPVALYREHLQRLERDLAAGRVDKKEAEGLRAQLERELLEQIHEADPPAMSSQHRAVAVALSLFVIAVSVAVYLQLGRPDSLLPEQQVDHTTVEGTAPALDDAVSGLAARLEANPNNVDDWLLLGRSYAAMDRWSEARDALARARELAPQRADILVDYAEVLGRLNGARLEGEPMTLLQRALRLEPNNPKALWLLGMGMYQVGEFSRAADTWDRLLATMPPEEPARAALEKQIAQARAQSGDPSSIAPAADSPAGAPANDDPPVATNLPETPGTSLEVEVSLAPEFAAQLDGTETLFVFARVPDGPPMPLAVQRMPLPRFPVRVVLHESMAMMPDMSLATFPQVVVGARISRAGTAAAQPGDLQVLSDIVTVDRDEAVRLVIDAVVE